MEYGLCGNSQMYKANLRAYGQTNDDAMSLHRLIKKHIIPGSVQFEASDESTFELEARIMSETSAFPVVAIRPIKGSIENATLYRTDCLATMGPEWLQFGNREMGWSMSTHGLTLIKLFYRPIT